jgi:hypothetical protein
VRRGADEEAPEATGLRGSPDDYVFGDFGDAPDFGAIYAVGLDAGHTTFAGEPEAIVTAAGGPVDIVVGPDGAFYYVAYVDGAVRRLAPEDEPPGACTTIPACQAVVDAALPDPAAAADKKSRKTAKKIGRFDRKADKKLAKAELKTGNKQAKLYRQARKALDKLLAAARSGDTKGRLGVALAPLEAAVNALLALVQRPERPPRLRLQSQPTGAILARRGGLACKLVPQGSSCSRSSPLCSDHRSWRRARRRSCSASARTRSGCAWTRARRKRSGSTPAS